MNLASAIRTASTRFGLSPAVFSPKTIAFLHAHRTPVLARVEALDDHTRTLCALMVVAGGPLQESWRLCLQELPSADPALVLCLRREAALDYMRTLNRSPLAPVPMETQTRLCGEQLRLMLLTSALLARV